MRVLVDTCIWSNVFRYKNPIPEDKTCLMKLVEDDSALIIGPIRQEFLSGIREINRYVGLREALRSFPDLPLKTELFEMGAEMFNDCRRKGVSASAVDMMVCSAAKYYGVEIWTEDPDFAHYKKCIDIQLYSRA